MQTLKKKKNENVRVNDMLCARIDISKVYLTFLPESISPQNVTSNNANIKNVNKRQPHTTPNGYITS